MTTNTDVFLLHRCVHLACLHDLSSFEHLRTCAPVLLLVHQWANVEDVNPDGAGHPESFANLSSAVIRGDWQNFVSISFCYA